MSQKECNAFCIENDDRSTSSDKNTFRNCVSFGHLLFVYIEISISSALSLSFFKQFIQYLSIRARHQGRNVSHAPFHWLSSQNQESKGYLNIRR